MRKKHVEETEATRKIQRPLVIHEMGNFLEILGQLGLGTNLTSKLIPRTKRFPPVSDESAGGRELLDSTARSGERLLLRLRSLYGMVSVSGCWKSGLVV